MSGWAEDHELGAVEVKPHYVRVTGARLWVVVAISVLLLVAWWL